MPKLRSKTNVLDKSIFPIENLPPELIHELIPHIGRSKLIGLNKDFNHLSKTYKWKYLTMDLSKIPIEEFESIQHVEKLKLICTGNITKDKMNKIIIQLKQLKYLTDIYIVVSKCDAHPFDCKIDPEVDKDTLPYIGKLKTGHFEYVSKNCFIVRKILMCLPLKNLYIENFNDPHIDESDESDDSYGSDPYSSDSDDSYYSDDYSQGSDVSDNSFNRLFLSFHLNKYINNFERIIYKDIKNAFLVYDKKIGLLILGNGLDKKRDFHPFLPQLLEHAKEFKTIILQKPAFFNANFNDNDDNYILDRLKGSLSVIDIGMNQGQETYVGKVFDPSFKDLKIKNYKKVKMVLIDNYHSIEEFLLCYFNKASVKDVFHS